MSQIPVIDFGEFQSNPAKVAKHVLEACKSIGFFYMINHGVPETDIDQAFELAKSYFDQSEEEKRKHLISEDNYGYSSLYTEKLDPATQRQGDHKEGFNFRNFVNGKSFAPLPPLFEENKTFIESFSRTCHATATRVLEAFAIALEIPESAGGKQWFAARHQYDSLSGQILRFLKYPRGAEADYKEPLRAGAHSDYGSVTLLFQKDVPGLEVQASRTEWIAAPLIPGAIIVNVGDQMEFWTNGLFKSTLHRVTFLPEHNHVDRYSIPFFVHPGDDVPLTPIPSHLIPRNDKKEEEEKEAKVITAGEHLRNRLNATYVYGA
ncbi:hypothetical protein EC973_004399 [Apophysomyces ossiformis]|uniref:Fe2OG dioxygenase domain-containing protein n=1 Tax=Apophysomyces ossiformis TaxID=679940 RepID=A0A8H7BSD8_9FUNG|nr:hypothetical protein EC973_004399 [Apophysomyces ossiformis]